MTVLSNLQRVLYPQAGFTKGDVVEYYTRVAPVILPHDLMALSRIDD